MDSVSEPPQFTRVTSFPSLPPGITITASTAAAGWTGVEGFVAEGHLADFYGYTSANTVIAFHLTAATRVEWKRSRRYTRFLSEAGSLTIIPTGAENGFRTDRWSRWLIWVIDEDRLQSLAQREWESRGARVEILETFNNRGAELWMLGQRLAERIGSPLPGSRLYAESLSTQIAIHLLWNHSSLTRPAGVAAERLTDFRLRRVVEFIHASLGNEISLGELADLAGLSPNYFLSAFRKATGKTPHRYLTEQRIARACQLLHNPYCSLVDVSLTVGFSSQSHLTTVFRRFMKTTPAAYREAVLGMRGDVGVPDRRNSEPQIPAPQGQADMADQFPIVKKARLPR
jgi:AraC family transcriptional regulator